MTEEEEIKQYVQMKVNPLLGPFMIELLKNRPNDIVQFVIKWMNDKGRYIFPSPINIRVGGLNRVEKQSKEKRQKINNESQNSDRSVSIINHQAPIELKQKVVTIKKTQESHSEDDENDEISELVIPVNSRSLRPRSSVSAEAFGSFNKRGNFKPREIMKNSQQKERIKNRLLQSFIFSSLDQRDLNIVINAMEIIDYKLGDWIIKQGDDGDYLYIVDQGEQTCMKVFKKGDEPTILKIYKPGESFGELSLLYNQQRQASIRAKTDSVLFALDRATFNNIVKDSAIKKRERYEMVLRKIDLLKSMDSYQIQQICDGVREQFFSKGEYIITQGEIGDKFYMVYDGELIATKQMNPYQEPVQVWQYKPGDYFGELALLKNQPRQANIIAMTDVTVVSLGQDTFKRLFGPLEDLLKQNADKYQK